MPASPKAALADSFGNVAELYDRVRLDYSDAAVDRLSDGLDLGIDAVVLDLAAGTGRLTRRLAARFDRVVAVEPNDDMRSLIRGVETLKGTAERIPLPASEFDAVFVADAFHWFDGPVALTEIARVLRPRGGLGLVWNHWWETEPPIPGEALALLDSCYARSGAKHRRETEDWHEGFRGSPFEPLAEETITERVAVDGGRLVELYLTTSSLAVLAAKERETLAAQLNDIVRGRFSIPVSVRLAWTRRVA